ncbi:MAG: restriction endonuclease subunit S [Desulfurivibrionaceae bacterium]
MAFERNLPLNEYITLQRGFDLPHSDRIEGGVPVVASTGIGGYHNEHKAEAPGVVIGRSGSIGGGQYITENFWPLNTTLWVKDFKGHVPRYVYYLLKSIDFSIFNVGSGVPTLNRNHLSSVLVANVGLDYEKQIAHILGSLDDKIELNRRMNGTLEAMAQALFKSWFVDFDPVIDNALAAGNPIPEPLHAHAETRKGLGDLHQPLSAAIQKQFPSRFVFTEEMGWVPEGWEMVATEEISTKIGMGPFGSNIKVSTFVESGVPIISGYHLNRTLLTDENYRFITESHAQKLKNSIVTKGDLVFTHAGNIGQVSLIPQNTTYPEYVISQRQFYLRPNVGRVLGSYLIYFFRSHIGQHKLLANASQVGVPSIARPSSHLKSIKLVLPGLDLLEYFDCQCKSVFESLTSNEEQIEVLTRLRDTLLPKLLSGQLRIPEAENQLAEVI